MSNSNYRLRPAARHTRKAEAESLAASLATPETPATEIQLLWVVRAYLADGDKAHLDSWCIVHAGTSYEEARDTALDIDALGCRDTNGRPCPPTVLDLACPETCWELREYLEYKRELSELSKARAAAWAADPKFQAACAEM